MDRTHQWLLLTYQLPARPSSARVKTWRRLQDIGAVATGTSAYVLPDLNQCREDAEWLQREIVAAGGHALVFSGAPRAPLESAKLRAAFRRSREQEYRALLVRIRQLRGRARPRKSTRATPAARRAIRGLRDRFDAIARIDFFHAPGRDAAHAALASLERSTARGSTAPEAVPADPNHAGFQNRRWVTRPRPGIDRIASAWLILRFIDPLATFAFTHEPAVSDVPFDMPETGFTHRDGMCTFETLVDAFRVQDPAALRLARIVHDLDLKDACYGLPEASSIGRVIDGLRGLYTDDRTLLERGIDFFDVFAAEQSGR